MEKLLSPTDWSHGVGQPLPRTSCLDTYSIAESTFTMRADSKKVANLSPGRESVRLVSNNLFGDGVYIFDVDHIPLGCGTVRFLPNCLAFFFSKSDPSRFLQWPAAWTTTVKQWPWGGEIDVLEGANSLGNNSIPAILQPQPSTTLSTLSTSSSSSPSSSSSSKAGDPSPRPGNANQSVNVVTLHTAPNCHLAAANTSALTTMSGTVSGDDCSGLSPGNVGCGVQIPGPSFGMNFNNVGGGVYAMWRDLQRYASASIKILILEKILTQVFLCPALARYVRGSGPGISIPLRMSRLVTFTIFEICVTVSTEFEFFICRSYKMGTTGFVSLSCNIFELLKPS